MTLFKPGCPVANINLPEGSEAQITNCLHEQHFLKTTGVNWVYIKFRLGLFIEVKQCVLNEIAWILHVIDTQSLLLRHV